MRQAIRNQVEHGRIDGQAGMAAEDFDVLTTFMAIFLDTRLPMNDAVAAAEHRRHRDWRRIAEKPVHSFELVWLVDVIGVERLV